VKINVDDRIKTLSKDIFISPDHAFSALQTILFNELYKCKPSF